MQRGEGAGHTVFDRVTKESGSQTPGRPGPSVWPRPCSDSELLLTLTSIQHCQMSLCIWAKTIVFATQCEVVSPRAPCDAVWHYTPSCDTDVVEGTVWHWCGSGCTVWHSTTLIYHSLTLSSPTFLQNFLRPRLWSAWEDFAPNTWYTCVSSMQCNVEWGWSETQMWKVKQMWWGEVSQT